jgi:hypothetical protein
MERKRRARERRKTWDRDKKGKDGFKMEVWEKSMRRLCWRIYSVRKQNGEVCIALLVEDEG